jgi:hypothetical protein
MRKRPKNGSHIDNQAATLDGIQATRGHALVLPPLEFGESAETAESYILAMLNEDAELLAIESKTDPAYAKVRQAFRVLVDEWLDSGRDQRGPETPKERNFEKSPKSQKALFSFSKSGGLLLLPFGRQPSLYFNSDDLPLALKGNGFEEIVHPQLAFILLSKLRVRLAKCRDCSTYFVLDSWAKTFKNGTKCDACRRDGRREGSVASTAIARDEAEALLYQKAAKKFSKKLKDLPDWHKDKALKTAIAVYLWPQILRLPALKAIHKKPITGKWTAQAKNWQGIEKALKAESDDATKRGLD